MKAENITSFAYYIHYRRQHITLHIKPRTHLHSRPSTGLQTYFAVAQTGAPTALYIVCVYLANIKRSHADNLRAFTAVTLL